MREIKFRGYSVDANYLAWIYGVPYEIDGEFYIIENMYKILCPTHRNKDKYDIIAECEKVNSKTIGQFTEYKDTYSDTEIYEGDIIKIYDDTHESIHVVMSHNSLEPTVWESNACGELESVLENFQVRIIGNIHDNMELLEGQ